MDTPKSLAWTPDEVARFWDYWSSRHDSQETYFALQVGAGVAAFAESVRPLAGLDILDFGSGPGHLIPHLLRRGARVSAVDSSENSISEVTDKFRGQSGWRGGKVSQSGNLPWGDASFDAAFCLETIEHLHTHDCHRIFDELFRVLRPGGFVVFTTPHDEDLTKQHVFCPNCETEFHRWQHLRSWSAAQLSERLQQRGYEVPFCSGLDFHRFQPPASRKFKLSKVKHLARHAILATLDRIFPRAFPHARLFDRRIRKGDGHHLAAVAFKPRARAMAA